MVNSCFMRILLFYYSLKDGIRMVLSVQWSVGLVHKKIPMRMFIGTYRLLLQILWYSGIRKAEWRIGERKI